MSETLSNGTSRSDQGGSPAASARRRLARKLIKDLAAFGGIAAADLAPATRKPQRQVSRITYRKNLNDAELDMLVAQVGVERLRAALCRSNWGPSLEAAE